MRAREEYFKPLQLFVEKHEFFNQNKNQTTYIIN